jgi:hypothetical protein
MFYSGIDQHKLSSVITTAPADGQREAQATVPINRQVLRQYLAHFRGPIGRLRGLLVPAGAEGRGVSHGLVPSVTGPQPTQRPGIARPLPLSVRRPGAGVDLHSSTELAMFVSWSGPSRY